MKRTLTKPFGFGKIEGHKFTIGDEEFRIETLFNANTAVSSLKITTPDRAEYDLQLHINWNGRDWSQIHMEFWDKTVVPSTRRHSTQFRIEVCHILTPAGFTEYLQRIIGLHLNLIGL